MEHISSGQLLERTNGFEARNIYKYIRTSV